MIYEGMNIAELIAERDGINARIKEMRVDAKENLSAVKEARETEARANLKVNDIVTFKFNKNDVEGGKVVRISEKSVTVESEVFTKGKSYRRYSDIVAITSSVKVAEEEVA